MAPRRQSVKNKHAFSYGVCPFCNKNILEGEKTNIEHVFPFSQINDSYGTKLKYSKNGGTGTDIKRIPLNIEKSIRILVHEDCNTQSGHDLENKISNIIKKLQDDSIESKQLTYDDIETIFQYGEKLAKFLPYLPDVMDRIAPPKTFNNVRIYPSVLPLGMIVDKTSVAMSFNGVAFVYSVSPQDDTPEYSININKHKHGYMYSFKDDYEQPVIVKEDEFVACRTFEISDLFFPIFEDNNQVSILLSPQDVSCLMDIDKSDIKNFRKQLNLRKLMQSGAISPLLLAAIKAQRYKSDEGRTELTEKDKNELKFYFGDDIFTKLKWLNDNTKFKFPDDVEDMVVYKDDRIQILHDGDFTDTEDLDDYTIKNDVLLGGEGLRTIEDLSGCIIDGSVVLSGNNLVNLDGSPSQVTRNFYCNHNQLTKLTGAPEHIGGNFDCRDNNLKSFDCPDTIIQGELHFDVKFLENLVGLPKANKYVCYTENDKKEEFHTASELHTWFEMQDSYSDYVEQRKATTQSSGYTNKELRNLKNTIKKLSEDKKTKISQGFYKFKTPQTGKKITCKSLQTSQDANEFVYINPIGAQILIHKIKLREFCQKYGIVDSQIKPFSNEDEMRAWFTEYKKGRDKNKKESLRAGAKKLKSANTVHDIKKQITPDDQHRM